MSTSRPNPQSPPEALDLTRLRWRHAVPLRVAFLHVPSAGGGAGPLSSIVRERRAVALDLLLLAHAVSPLAKDGWTRAPSTAWATAIGLRPSSGVRAAVSRSWTWLESQQLITTRAEGQARAVRVLRDDGSGLAWLHPAQEDVPYLSFLMPTGPAASPQSFLWQQKLSC